MRFRHRVMRSNRSLDMTHFPWYSSPAVERRSSKPSEGLRINCGRQSAPLCLCIATTGTQVNDTDAEELRLRDHVARFEQTPAMQSGCQEKLQPASNSEIHSNVNRSVANGPDGPL